METALEAVDRILSRPTPRRRWLTLRAARLLDYPPRPRERAWLLRNNVQPPFERTQLATLRVQRIVRACQRTRRYVCLVYTPDDALPGIPEERSYFRGGMMMRELASRIERHNADGSVDVLKNRGYAYP